ncbi:DegT/DnrJ/EryC1/StrS family aminotransferase [Hymenobacter properus]|uniref:DegT/DnrJ/EryC1/StrS family aminotransferase n=1 Tax=Hymenobacter properus TaxID=2791026 RepID=A0A931BL79_9BACT|nr:DegT/DnrJ/EryC1/StrS family aminotransferase [Hymenobacter properus]MBF9143441.1 DegT/DnrJ/EryC1/StrS family aminotransferase [Hymenobacter properus]MBR7722254.1 DegT/DnrJ/EryC1/StrS family aminotransferase [Microvirga sp. SRT04]
MTDSTSTPLAPGEKPISMFSTFVHPSAPQRVAEVLASTMLSEGKQVKAFEEQLAERFGLVHPAALNSGTSALHLALEVAGVGAGDEVILSAQTFIASAITIVQTGAKPVFADIYYENGNINPADIEHRITARTKAIMAVHWGGYPCDMDEIRAIAARHGLAVIEDAAHAIGATYRGQAIGAISDYTCFSFQAIKHLTTGDGGALCALDPAKAREVFRRRWFGIDRANSPVSETGERVYDLTDVGYKYHLSDYAATLGLANLNGFEERMAHRRQLVAQYQQGLANVPGLKHFEHQSDRESANWLFGFHVENRPAFMRHLKAHGIASSVVHDGIDRNTLFGGKRMDLVQQRRFDETQVHVPLHDDLTAEQVDYIIRTIKQGW